jgi:long-chain acyl-CoA synthetase
MRVLAVGGAPVSPAHQELLRGAFPHAGLDISMGDTSSEAVAVVTRIAGAELRDHPTSAGQVLPTTAVDIRDAEGRPVPEGVDGEIHVCSPYLMTGYRRDDPATRAVLKPGRWLAMGDLGCLRDGRLFVNSRARDLILVDDKVPTQWVIRHEPLPRNPSGKVLERDPDGDGAGVGQP